MKAKKPVGPASRIVIDGEGRDEWGNRYLKLAVKGSDLQMPPFSVDEISSDPQPVYSTLSNAGVNIFTTASKTQVLSLVEASKQSAPSFKVITRLGWNSGAIVRPDGVIGSPKRRLEPSFRDLD